MKKFAKELTALQDQLFEMGHLAESMVAMATSQLLSKSAGDVFDAVMGRERRLDKMQLDIDHEAVRMLTVYGPVATDLRYLLTVMHVNSALERMGDQAVNLCEDLQLLTARPDAVPKPVLGQMARIVNEMVRGALDAVVGKNARIAEHVMTRDDLVDSMNDQVVRELLSDEVVREVLRGPKDIAGALAQILVARSMERIGDQAVNICEDVIYMVKGADVRHAEEMAEMAAEEATLAANPSSE